MYGRSIGALNIYIRDITGQKRLVRFQFCYKTVMSNYKRGKLGLKQVLLMVLDRRFTSLGWELIENTLKKRKIIMTFKALQGQLPDYILECSELCVERSEGHVEGHGP